MDIGYVTEDPAGDYAKAVDSAKTPEDLIKVLGLWRRVANDALEIAHGMSAADFLQFREGLKKERRGTFAGEEWAKKFMPILMPDVMFHVSMIAEQFKAPWGCAYIRCREEKLIAEKNGVATWHEKEAA